MREQKGECQTCKAMGKYRAATMVHHVNHVRDAPQLALSEMYIDADGKEQRNLIALCDACHDDAHPELRPKIKAPLTEEWW